MSVRLAKAFRPGVLRFRAGLVGEERTVFDLLCLAGELGYRMPDRKINLAAGSRSRDPRQRLRLELPALRARQPDRQRLAAWRKASNRLAQALLSHLAASETSEEVRALRVLLAYTTIALAPDNTVPQHPLARAAWDCAVRLFAELFPSQVEPLGVLACVGRGMRALHRETAAGLQIGRVASGQRPGRAGCRLAIDPELIAAVGKALGKDFVPGYMARYLFYTKPGDHIWPHPDDPTFMATVLICVSHEPPFEGETKSAFVAYPPDGSHRRYELAPGEALAVEPGMIHAREPVRPGEKVALLSIGLCAAPAAD